MLWEKKEAAQHVVRNYYVKVKKLPNTFVVVFVLYPGFRLLWLFRTQVFVFVVFVSYPGFRSLWLFCTQVFVSDVDVYILKNSDPKWLLGLLCLQ